MVLPCGLCRGDLTTSKPGEELGRGVVVVVLLVILLDEWNLSNMRSGVVLPEGGGTCPRVGSDVDEVAAVLIVDE